MAKESLAKVWESTTKAMSTAKIMITAKTVRRKRKKDERERKRTRKRRETSAKLEFSRLLQDMWQVEAQGERVLTRLRASCGGSSEFFCEFSGTKCNNHICGCEDSSVYSRIQ